MAWVNPKTGEVEDDGFLRDDKPKKKRVIESPKVSIYEKSEHWYPAKFYFIKSTGELVVDGILGCYKWNAQFQSWREESISFLHDMIEAGVIFELQAPFRGFENNPIPSKEN